jgi:hypothetical protein
MKSRCPPGVICIENLTIFYVILCFGLIALYFYMNRRASPNVIIQKEYINSGLGGGFNQRTPMREDIVKSSGRVEKTTGDIRGIPINIKTQGFNSNYSQIGILTRENGDEKILPLMGRPTHANRSKWQYYTMSDSNNIVKLPVSRGGKSGTKDYGMDELFNGDNVYVEGYNDTFKATIYDNDSLEYIPYI